MFEFVQRLYLLSQTRQRIPQIMTHSRGSGPHPHPPPLKEMASTLVCTALRLDLQMPTQVPNPKHTSPAERLFQRSGSSWRTQTLQNNCTRGQLLSQCL
ncbi:hypothetical protein UPYG_G00195980 [Umbra pygmaea]|uniref:Uncharacterized protein n=1 Tax=Umbra pygmaea TaxID=75934 RepID=A0ABD0WH60_UMBPY